jgi:hypothetical protein
MVNYCGLFCLLDDFEMIELCFTNDSFGQRLNGSDVVGMIEFLLVIGMKGSLQDCYVVGSLCYRITISLLQVCSGRYKIIPRWLEDPKLFEMLQDHCRLCCRIIALCCYKIRTLLQVRQVAAGSILVVTGSRLCHYATYHYVMPRDHSVMLQDHSVMPHDHSVMLHDHSVVL